MRRAAAALLLALCAAASAALAQERRDDPTRRPVSSGRDLHIACGQAEDDFADRIYEPVARSIMLVQCHAIVSAAVELIRGGAYTLDGKPAWTCVDIPDRPGELAADYLAWIARNPRAGRRPAVLAFVQAVEETYPCAE